MSLLTELAARGRMPWLHTLITIRNLLMLFYWYVTCHYRIMGIDSSE